MRFAIFSRAIARRTQAAFTLIELLAVIAIITLLAAVALPAYNNYSVKSKFSEVVLATAPTKTAISTCAVSGDCVSAGAISLGTTGVGSTGAAVYQTSNTTSTPMSQAMIWAAYYATLTNFGLSAATSAAAATTNATSGSAYYLLVVGGNPNVVCIAGQTDAQKNTCSVTSVPASLVQAALSPTLNPYNPAVSTSTLASLPCVGASSTGCSPATKYVAGVSYDGTGLITATAKVTSGLNAETFVLTPSYSGGRIDWSVSGSCKTRAGGALC